MAVRPCLRLFVHVASGIAHTRTRMRTHGAVHESLRVCPRVLLGQRVVQTRVYQRGTLLPWTRSKLPVRHFVSAILFARYLAGYFDLDALRSLRYLFACTPMYGGPRPLRANASRIATNRLTGASRFRRDADAPSSARELFFTDASRRAKLQAYGATST